MSAKEEMSAAVLEAVHSVWDEWSRSRQSFLGERDLQTAFAGRLQQVLPSGWAVARETGLRLPRKFSAWTRYDIGVSDGSRVVALLELSYADTNVPHSLHNGELKLLGNCDAKGVGTGMTYAEERDFCPDDVATVRGKLESVPVRGLFFVNPGPRKALDSPQDAMWWETKPVGFQAETRFWSALMSPARTATLREVFSRLAGAGLSCWYYSLCDEERLVFAAN